MPPYSTAHDLAMDAEGAHPNIQLGQIDNVTGADQSYTGAHLSIITAASVGLATWPGATKLFQLRLVAGDTSPTSNGRFDVEVYGKDALETDFEVGLAQQHMAWHYDGQDYWYMRGMAYPSNYGWDVANARPNLQLKSDLIHQDTWIDGNVAVNGAGGGFLHGHNAHGLAMSFNRAGLVQQFTPRPGDGFLPPLSDTRAYWAFQGDFGDVTNADNNYGWAIRLLNPDELMWFAIRLKKRDYSIATSGAAHVDQHGVDDTDPGRIQIWAYTEAEKNSLGLAALLSAAPIIDFSGSTSPWGITSDATAFDPASPDASEPGGPRWPTANQMPRYMRKRPRYTYAAQFYYVGGSNTLPATAGILTTGTRRFQTKADAFGTLFSGAAGAAPTNTASPTISGTLETGYQLAGAVGTWTGTPTYTYQWEVETAPGSGSFVAVSANGTGLKYIVPQLLLGYAVRLAVTGTNAFGSFTARSAATAALTKGQLEPGIRGPENPVVQDGNWAATPIQVGAHMAQLTAAGLQGDGVAGHICQAWRTDISSVDTGIEWEIEAIGGANYAFSHILAAKNPGTATTKAYICSFVQGIGWRIFLFDEAAGTQFTVLSGPVVTPVPAPAMKVRSKRAGTTLSIETSTDGGATWTAVPGLTVNDSTIAGAGTIGFEISDAGPTAAFKLFDQVAINSAPAIITAPAIAGTAPLGDGVLTVSDGTWANGTTSITYQWTRAGVNIAGATSSTYIKDPADVGHTVGCNVTATNANGPTTVAATGGVIVTQNAPTSLTPPTITGDPSASRALLVQRGTWSDSPLSYTQQWMRRLPGGIVAPISGATGLTYVPVDGDVGYLISVSVIATNAGGVSDPATAAEVGPIAARSLSRRFMWNGTQWL